MIDLSPKQQHLITNSTARVNLAEGAIRSGKTIATTLRFLLYLGRAPTHGEIVLTGRTRDSIWRNIIAPLQSPLFHPIPVLGNFGAPIAHILGRRCWILGASDTKAEKTIRGMTVAGALVDETTTLPQEFFTQLLGRMSVPGARMFATTNPDTPAHWLKTRFLDRNIPDWRVWHFTLDDNPALTDAYKTAIKNEFTGLWYRRFIEGEWVAGEGAVYSMWNPTHHLVNPDDIPTNLRLIGLGIDHGTTNPTAGTLLGLHPQTGALYILDEFWSDMSLAPVKLTTAQQTTAIRQWLGTRDPEWWIVDPAAAPFIAQLHDDHTTRVQPANNTVTTGISMVARLLASHRLRISTTCTNLIREIPSYTWDPNATAKGEDKPVKTADHAVDALRYAIATTEHIWSRYPWTNTL